MRKITLLLLIVVASTAGAQIIHVPANYPTIQQGIEAAQPGDTVLVADGVYYEQITINKKPLLVTSNFYFNGDSTHLFNTIIDGGQLTSPNRTVVTFTNVDSTAVLAGFTIQNGKGTRSGDIIYGGGIRLLYSGAKIMHNRIVNNMLNGGAAPFGENCKTAGAGIASLNYSDKWIVISNNVIAQNTSSSSLGYTFGTGGYVRSNTRFANNIVSGNLAKGFLEAYAEGSGFCVDGFDAMPVSLIATFNKFLNNIIDAPIFTEGAGLLSLRSTNIITNNTFYGNKTTAMHNFAGGLSLIYVISPTTVVNNEFKDNKAAQGSGLYINLETNESISIENNTFINNEATLGGGGVYCRNGTILFQNNVFNGNSATSYGGAIQLYKIGLASTNVTLVNNTFSGNSSNEGGAVSSYKCNPLFLNNIFWSNEAVSGKDVIVLNGEASMAYCNIDASELAGDVNILHCVFYLDPLFCDTTCLAISCDSPCKNSGTSDYTFGTTTVYAPSYDNTGIPRPLEEVFDIGAHEFDSTLVQRTNAFREADFSIYPNPANNMIYCRYRLEKDANVFFNLYDLTGKALINWHTHLKAGEHTIPLQLKELPAGIYLLKLQVNDQMVTRKVIKN